MKVPLMAISGRNSFNRQTRQQNIIIWGRGRDKLIVPSPREHYYYMKGDGELILQCSVKAERFLIKNIS